MGRILWVRHGENVDNLSRTFLMELKSSRAQESPPGPRNPVESGDVEAQLSERA